MFALPEKFLENMSKMLGDEYPAFLRALEQPSALALRLNPKRAGAEEIAREFIEATVPWARWGRYLIQREELRPGSSIAHAGGAFYLQEASAMASAAALDPRPGESILDLCAAPGGKSTQIAAAMEEKGLLVSNDPEPSRAKVLAGNLERMGASNAVVVSALPQKLADRWGETFDAILVDAPCSGEGMFRRDPASRDEWNPASPEGCARRQAEILDQAARLLRPGGRLVYSTCTFNDIENEGSVSRFLERHPDFSPEDFSLAGVGDSVNGTLRLLPHRLRGDGHFVARLRRAGEPKPPREIPSGPESREISQLLRALEDEIGPLPDFIRGMRPFALGDRLYCHPGKCPPLDGLKVISPGVCLARAGRSHVEPEHALAMALPSDSTCKNTELDETRASAWLRGETLPIDGERGWTLVTWRGLPLGWGKISDGILKNHLPKGLRRIRKA